MRRKWPALPVLGASGYSREEAPRLGIPIGKPYTVQLLAATIAKTLEAASESMPARRGAS
jgi:hypothetical protein